MSAKRFYQLFSKIQISHFLTVNKQMIYILNLRKIRFFFSPCSICCLFTANLCVYLVWRIIWNCWTGFPSVRFLFSFTCKYFFLHRIHKKYHRFTRLLYCQLKVPYNNLFTFDIFMSEKRIFFKPVINYPEILTLCLSGWTTEEIFMFRLCIWCSINIFVTRPLFCIFILFIFFNANFVKYFFFSFRLYFSVNYLVTDTVFISVAFRYFRFYCLFTSKSCGYIKIFVCVITYTKFKKNVRSYRILSSVLFIARAKSCTVGQSLWEQRLLHLLFIENIMTVKYESVIHVHSVCTFEWYEIKLSIISLVK